MAQGLDDTGRTARPWRRPALARESVQYTLAVLGYIALIDLTKEYLTFTWGVFYFVTVLEFLPGSSGAFGVAGVSRVAQR